MLAFLRFFFLPVLAIVIVLAAFYLERRAATTRAVKSVGFIAVNTLSPVLVQPVHVRVGRTIEEAGAPSQPSGRPKDFELRSFVQRLAASPPTQQRDEQIRQMLSALVAQNPRAAIELAIESFPGLPCPDALAAVLEAWARSDPTAAWEWTIANSAPEETRQLGIVLAEIAREDAALALRYAADAATLQPGIAEDCYAPIFDAMMQSGNYADALQAAQQAFSSNLLLNWSQRIASQWAVAQPQTAEAWLQTAANSPARDRMLVEFSQASATNPTHAVELAFQIQLGELRRSALTEAVIAWFNTDPVAATAWINRFDLHADLDGAVAFIATLPYIVTARTDVALGWAESIVSEDMRLERLGAIISAWAIRDRGAALKYIENSPLMTEVQRQALMGRINRNSQAPNG